MAGPGGLGSGPYVTSDKLRHRWKWLLFVAVLTGMWIYLHYQ
jgi:hypothetical protein